MNIDTLLNYFFSKFEKVIIFLLVVASMLAVAYAAIAFVALLVATIFDQSLLDSFLNRPLDQEIGVPIARLQAGLYHIFGGFLLILLGLELMNTVRTYATESHVKIESIVAISIIATARHLITLDYHHSNPLTIFAAGFVVISLIVGYYLLKKRPGRPSDN